jgi:hypothetical protein
LIGQSSQIPYCILIKTKYHYNFDIQPEATMKCRGVLAAHAGLTAVTALALLLAPSRPFADERPYAFTYEPVVSAAGEKELELYETLSEARSGARADRTWEHKLELGYGVTDELSISGYAVFRSTADKRFQPSGFRAEGRYKVLGARSPVELVLYLEGEKEVVDDKPWGVEEKLILGKDYGPVSWALNLVAEQEFPAGGGTETRWGWSAGVAARAGRALRVGAESFGARHREVGGDVSWEAYAGPTAVVSLPSGPFNTAWLIAGAALGLTEVSDQVQARLVLGCDF